MTPSVFLSYRRLDSEAEAGRLFTSLQRELPHVDLFLDTSVIEPGAEWPTKIEVALKAATTVVVVIGADWLRAGSDDWGQRPIDSASDWVRRELESALGQGKRIIPVLVRLGTMPPPAVLPASVRRLTTYQALELRGSYWDHDVRLLVQQLSSAIPDGTDDEIPYDPYPKPPTVETAEAIGEQALSLALEGPLNAWRVTSSPLPESPSQQRVELFREYKFASFESAVAFMAMVAKGCDILNHHPRWENIWKTLRVYLTTWNIQHRISDRDIQLAKYFDAAFQDYRKE